MKKFNLFNLLFLLGLLFLLFSCTEEEKVTITFESNGGTTVNEVRVIEGGLIEIPEVSREGYTFDGWYISLNEGVTLDERWSFLTDIATQDITLYAKWNINSYTITFETNGGSSISSLTQAYDSVVIGSPTTTKEGYEFVGWYKDQTLLEPYTLTNIPAENLTLYAKWDVSSYTLSFDSVGGTFVEPITQDYLSYITEPTEPTKENYTFDGWYLEDTYDTLYSFDTMPAEDMTLYAKWSSNDGLIHISNLTIAFVPSRDFVTMELGLSYLPDVLIAELEAQGYTIDNLEIQIGTTYEAVGEGLLSGAIQVAYTTAGSYAAYSNEHTEAILSVSRSGLSKDSSNPQDWNDGQPTVANPDYKVPYYRSIGVAGITPKARELANKVNSGQQITWEDLQTAKIGVQSVTSSSGRVYPSLLFHKLYGYTLNDLPSNNIIQVPGYGGGAAALAAGEIDFMFGYADFRMDYADEWIGIYGRTLSIWDETDVIFVTDGIYNDAIVINTESIDLGLQEAFEQAFMNIATDFTQLESPEGDFVYVRDIFNRVYYVEAFMFIDDEDYDNARLALELMMNP